MSLKHLEIQGFKSFAKKADFEFSAPITAIVGPNGSGKSNVAEAFRFVLGEQSIKSLRGKKGEDLIFAGESMRLNRAAVKVVFNNAPHETPDGEKRLLPIEYDEVSIERAVYRDGTNEYMINGSKVRLKDVSELLASANIGASGHHIISQGEADRILASSPKERRTMLEDALGLRLYQYKKQESQKKLEKTHENRMQVENLRRENQPHLKFLERQAAKIEKSRSLREELLRLYHEYFVHEEMYLVFEEDAIASAREEPDARLQKLNVRISELRASLEQDAARNESQDATLKLEHALSGVRDEMSRLLRELGSVEGQLESERRRIETEKRRQLSEEDRSVPVRDVSHFVEALDSRLSHIETLDDLGLVRKALAEAREQLQEFRVRARSSVVTDVDASSLLELSRKREKVSHELEACRARQATLEHDERTQKEIIERARDESRSAERELFSLMQEQNDVRLVLGELTVRADRLARTREEFKRECAEAEALLGRDVLDYRDADTRAHMAPVALEETVVESRRVQEERRRNLERLKIRLEELGGANAEEILREYREVKERDEFLAREIDDLEKSAASLEELITQLDQELEQKFSEGVERISSAFSEFFTKMFGGGRAGLLIIKEQKRRRVAELFGVSEDAEEEEDEPPADDVLAETGIEVTVALPNKKVKGLMMLSGGERALASIALVFAMSRVNPPPFLILDETDAALDEANSRRYGDMIEDLSRESQLIVITHNRETMSRAGVLYGVTMGGDGISKLLSVKFEEGVQYAK